MKKVDVALFFSPSAFLHFIPRESGSARCPDGKARSRAFFSFTCLTFSSILILPIPLRYLVYLIYVPEVIANMSVTERWLNPEERSIRDERQKEKERKAFCWQFDKNRWSKATIVEAKRETKSRAHLIGIESRVMDDLNPSRSLRLFLHLEKAFFYGTTLEERQEKKIGIGPMESDVPEYYPYAQKRFHSITIFFTPSTASINATETQCESTTFFSCAGESKWVSDDSKHEALESSNGKKVRRE